MGLTDAAIIAGLIQVPAISLPPISHTATTYYVDANAGSDANAGKAKTEAFATIHKAMQTIRGGDVVYVLPGTYHESVAVSQAGTEAGYTTVMGMPDMERPKIRSSPSIYNPLN